MAKLWRTNEWYWLGRSQSRGTTTRFQQKRKWRDRHQAPTHHGRAATTRQLQWPFIFLQLLRQSLHLSWDWWRGVWCDVHTSHPTSSTKTIPDPGSVQQQLWLRQQRVWRQLPDLCQMQSHISLSRDLPRQSAYLHNLQCWTATPANLYTTLQARTTTAIQHWTTLQTTTIDTNCHRSYSSYFNEYLFDTATSKHWVYMHKLSSNWAHLHQITKSTKDKSLPVNVQSICTQFAINLLFVTQFYLQSTCTLFAIHLLTCDSNLLAIYLHYNLQSTCSLVTQIYLQSTCTTICNQLAHLYLNSICNLLAHNLHSTGSL